MNKATRILVLLCIAEFVVIINIWASSSPVRMPVSQPIVPTATAYQQVSTPSQVTFFGTIDKMEGNIWTISDQKYVMNPFQFPNTLVSVGDQVKVQAAMDSDGSLSIIKIEQLYFPATSGGWILVDGTPLIPGTYLQSQPDPDDLYKFEIIGMVSAVDMQSITVNGQIYDLSPFGEFISNVKVGDMVKLEILMDQNGQVIVREIVLTRH